MPNETLHQAGEVIDDTLKKLLAKNVIYVTDPLIGRLHEALRSIARNLGGMPWRKNPEVQEQ